MDTILEKTWEIIRQRYGPRLETTRLAAAVIGIHFTGVRLSSGFSGMAQTELSQGAGCCFFRPPSSGFLRPGNLSGGSLAGLLADENRYAWRESLRLAVLNAISAELMGETAYRVLEGKDPLDLLDPDDPRPVCLVGAFPAYVKRLAVGGAPLKVLELDPGALPPEYQSFYVPAALAPETLPQAGAVIITGSTLVNHTLDDLLNLISPQAKVFLAGPTCSLIPDVLFERGVSVVGATRILDSEGMLRVLAEGGVAHHLFPHFARKICVINERSSA